MRTDTEHLWSQAGATVATGRKWERPNNGSNRPFGSQWEPTATVSQRMVRRGSTVRAGIHCQYRRRARVPMRVRGGLRHLQFADPRGVRCASRVSLSQRTTVRVNRRSTSRSQSARAHARGFASTTRFGQQPQEHKRGLSPLLIPRSQVRSLPGPCRTACKQVRTSCAARLEVAAGWSRGARKRRLDYTERKAPGLPRLRPFNPPESGARQGHGASSKARQPSP
jgi:hypothetical protein